MLSSHVEHESQKDESKDGRRGPELYPPGGVPVAAAVAAEVLVVSCQELLLRLAHGTEKERERERMQPHPIEVTRESFCMLTLYTRTCMQESIHNQSDLLGGIQDLVGIWCPAWANGASAYLEEFMQALLQGSLVFDAQFQLLVRTVHLRG